MGQGKGLLMSDHENKVDVIQSIEPVEEYDLDGDTGDGYVVRTRLREIVVLISDDQGCCEQFGYMATSDNISDYIGASLLGVDVCEFDEDELGREYVTRSFPLDHPILDPSESMEAAFIYLRTSAGALTLAVYNEHNGYYGHSVFIRATGPGISRPDKDGGGDE